MDGGKKTSSNKVLIGVLVFLCVAIVGLVVGIVVVNVGANYERENAWKEGMSETEIAYYDYVNDFDKVQGEAEKLLAENPVDAIKIINLYSPYVEKCLADGAVDRASAYIRAEQNSLLKANYKQEALNELTKIDYSVFNEPEQYKYYTNIIELAKELGESGVVVKYEPLAMQTKEAYERNYAAAEKAAAEAVMAKEKSEQAEEVQNEK